MKKLLFQPVENQIWEFPEVFIGYQLLSSRVMLGAGRMRVQRRLAHVDGGFSREGSKPAFCNLTNKPTECQ